MNISRKVQIAGNLMIEHFHTPDAPLDWKIRNAMRPGFIWGLITTWLAKMFSRLTGLPVIISQLEIVKRYGDGHLENYGVVGRRVVTNNGVGFIVDAWQNSVELEIMKYHGCGTGTNVEAAADSALQTECTTALNPDNTRGTGTLTESASNAFQTVGSVTFDASAAVTEHGLFSQAATGGGVLMDRTVFTAVNVVSTDSLQFTYTITFTAGG